MQRLIRARYDKRGPYGETFRYESAREYLRTARDVDLIVISRTAFLPSGAFGLQEDYETTVEALQASLSSLAPDGILYVQMFILPPPRYELRMANNLAQALRGMGVKRVSDCLLVFRSWDTMNFLIRKSGFTTDNQAVVKGFIEDMGFARVWPKSEGPTAILGADYGELFHSIIDQNGRAEVESGYPFDVRITTDDRPFFHYFLKLGKTVEVFRLVGNKWAYFIYEGMALPFLTGFLIVISLVLFVGVFLSSHLTRNTAPRSDRTSSGLINYPLQRGARYLFFALIGTGFMFVEAFFIHALILPLGSPERAFAFTLAALLLGCGAGSLASSSVGRKGVVVPIALAPALLLVCALCFPFVRESPFLILFALSCGLPLGVFFPSGVRFLCGSEGGAIPLAYALNGAASIIAPPLASVVASAMGLKMLLVWSTGIYLAAAFVLALSLLMFKDSGKVG
jgi:hypothetical protein